MARTLVVVLESVNRRRGVRKKLRNAGRTDRAGEVGQHGLLDREGERWVVTGRLAERAVAFDDLTKPEAADLAARRLAAAGVDEALRRLGAVEGDEVQIGEIVFEFSDDEAV